MISRRRFQPVVADDYAAVEVVKIGGGKTAAIQRNQWTQFGRYNRDVLHHHPLGAVGDPGVGVAERFYHAQAFEGIRLALLRGFGCSGIAQVEGKLVQVDPLQQVVHGLGPHLGDKLVGVVVGQVLIVLGQRFQDVQVFFFGEQVAVVLSFVSPDTGLDHNKNVRNK